MNRLLLSILFVVYIVKPVFSEKKAFLNTLKEDSIHILRSPLRVKKSLVTVSILSTGFIGFLITDEKIQPCFEKDKWSQFDGVFSVTKYLGDGRVTLTVFSLYYLYGKIFNDRKARHIFYKGVESFIIAGLLCSGLKVIFGRARPYLNKGAYDFSLLDFRNSRMSLPSGHATVAFSFASVIDSNTHNLLLKMGVYSAAGFCALSRVYNNCHWASDIFLGSLLGFYIGKYVCKEKDSNLSFKILPSKKYLVYRFRF